MKTPKEKYYSDPHYHQLVDVMVGMITQAKYTPSEMREAAILASIIYEERLGPRTVVLPKEVVKWLDSKEDTNRVR